MPSPDPICAPATPPFPAAVAVVRVSGPHLASRLAPLVALPAPRRAEVRTLAWDGFRERALVLHFPAPASLTGEDVVELQVHGNPLLVRRLIAHLGRLGIRLAEPGEFSRRALLNGKQGLLEAEAVRDLVGAETDTQLRQAQARASAPPWLAEARAVLTPWVARAEGVVDYGEEEGILLDHNGLVGELLPLATLFHVELRRARAAHALRDGLRLALAGRPNAGKSTLFNALAGEDRAIVAEVPGTTRDVLEVRCEWRGLPLRLFDTAGVRDTEDPVERLGVARVAPVLAEADLILHLVPAPDAGPDAALERALAPHAGKVLEVRTFGDRAPAAGVVVSAATGDLDALEAALREHLLGGLAPDACLGALATDRQVALLEDLARQVDLLAALEPGAPPEVGASLLQGALALLARLTGEDRTDTTLDALFAGFCLGK